MTSISERAAMSLANWRTAPHNAWSFQHVAEFVPTATIQSRAMSGRGPVAAGALEGLEVSGRDGRPVALETHFRDSHTDGFVALKHGASVGEWYGGHADPDLPHVIFSVSKSVTAVLAGIAAADGRLDPAAPVTTYVPEIRGSAYGDATVRDLLDMVVSIDFDEAYLDAGGAFDRYRRAMLWNPARPGEPEENMVGFLSTLAKAGHPHGKRFHYVSPNTDMLGLVVERAAGMRFPDYLAERLWGPMGATGSAYVTVDRAGASRAAGGICITVADLARLGQLILDGGRTAEGARVIPTAWIDDMRSNGDRQAWVDGNFFYMFPDGRYRSCWYDVGDGRGSFCAIGIHGQWLWVDPTSRVVLAKVSSLPEPSDDPTALHEIKVLGEIARML